MVRYVVQEDIWERRRAGNPQLVGDAQARRRQEEVSQHEDKGRTRLQSVARKGERLGTRLGSGVRQGARRSWEGWRIRTRKWTRFRTRIKTKTRIRSTTMTRTRPLYRKPALPQPVPLRQFNLDPDTAVPPPRTAGPFLQLQLQLCVCREERLALVELPLLPHPPPVILVCCGNSRPLPPPSPPHIITTAPHNLTAQDSQETTNISSYHRILITEAQAYSEMDCSTFTCYMISG